MTATQRWQRLERDGMALLQIRRNSNKALERLDHEDELSDHRLFSAVRTCFGAVALGHLHLVSREEALRRAAQGAAAALQWAFGDWRKPGGWKGPRRRRPATERQRGESGWFENYRWGLLLAFIAEEKDAVLRLLEWPEPDLIVDVGTFYYTQEDNWFHIYLALTPGKAVGGVFAAPRKAREEPQAPCKVHADGLAGHIDERTFMSSESSS